MRKNEVINTATLRKTLVTISVANVCSGCSSNLISIFAFAVLFFSRLDLDEDDKDKNAISVLITIIRAVISNITTIINTGRAYHN